MYPIKVKTCGDKILTLLPRLLQLSASLFEVRFVPSFSAWSCAKKTGESTANWSEGGTERPSGRKLKGTEKQSERRGEEIRREEKGKERQEACIMLMETPANKANAPQTHTADLSTCLHLPVSLCDTFFTPYRKMSLRHHQGPAAASQHHTQPGSHTETLFCTDWYSWSGN